MTDRMAVETSARETMKIIETGENAEKMTARTASEMIEEADAIDEDPLTTSEGAARATKVTESSEMRGELSTAALSLVFSKLICHRGVPVVGSSEATPAQVKAKRDAATADALAKAKAMVEAEQNKSADKVGEIAGPKEVVAESGMETSENGIRHKELNGSKEKKRAREEDDEAEPEAKKVDIKSETEKAES